MRLEIGQKAPDFSIPLCGGGQFVLADELKKTESGAIVYFYPRASTPGCTTEACDFRDSLASLQGAGFAVVGISPDKMGELEKFAQKYSMSFPLSTDEDQEVMKA